MFGANYFGQPYFGQGYAVTIAGYLINLSDTVTVSDSIKKTVTAPKVDSITATDAIVKTFTKPLTSDVVTTSDAISKIPTKKLADSVTATDAIIKTNTKKPADSVTATGAMVKTFTKKLAEVVVTSDVRTLVKFGNGSRATWTPAPPKTRATYAAIQKTRDDWWRNAANRDAWLYSYNQPGVTYNTIYPIYNGVLSHPFDTKQRNTYALVGKPRATWQPEIIKNKSTWTTE